MAADFAEISTAWTGAVPCWPRSGRSRRCGPTRGRSGGPSEGRLADPAGGGTQDALVPAKVLRAVLAARPDWEGHVLDDRRHALMLEDPAAYLDMVDGWHVGAAAA